MQKKYQSKCIQWQCNYSNESKQDEYLLSYQNFDKILKIILNQPEIFGLFFHFFSSYYNDEIESKLNPEIRALILKMHHFEFTQSKV